jgi:hypothetical protein
VSAWPSIGSASIVEREAVLLSVRDLVVLVVVLAVVLWIASNVRKHS